MSHEISRRGFLGGAATAIGLPLALRRPAAGADCAAPKRFVAYYLPNGMMMNAFTPSGEGTNWTPSRILTPIAAHKQDVTVITGLANKPGIPERGAFHAAATGAFITANHVAPNTTNIRAAVSLDQKIAQAIGGCTKLPSMQLGVDEGRAAGDCDHGYSCAYWGNISWSSPTTLLPKIVDPRAAFDRLFKGFDQSATLAARARRYKYRTSVLDYVIEDAKRLEQELAKGDRPKLDQFLTSVREVEKGVEKPDAAAEKRCSVAAAPADVGGDVVKKIDAMHEIMALGMQCDATRVFTFMLGNSVSNRNFSFIGAAGDYHGISHHGNNPDNIEKLVKIETWELQQFAKFLARLKQVDEGGGKTLLDNSAIYLSSEFSDPNPHDYKNLPTLLAGRAGGALSPGRHIRVPGQTPMANLFVSLLRAFGLPDSTFGDDGKAALAGL